MSASQYTFKDLIRFFKRVDLNLNFFSERYLAAAQQEFPTEVSNREIEPSFYEAEYKDLFKIFTVVRNERAMISKRDIQILFKIKNMNVTYDEEPVEFKESLKKPKSKEILAKSSSRKKVFDNK
jgi:pantothenate synthetase